MHRLTPDELEIHHLLRTQKDGEKHASLYHASKVCWLDETNPERIICTAHCIRELLKSLSETFGETLDIPILASKVNEMVRRFDVIMKDIVIDSDGLLPADTLLPLFESIEALRQSKNKDRFGMLVENTNLGTIKLPTDAKKRESNRWEALYTYFVKVAHQSDTTGTDMRNKMDEFDELLRFRFNPAPAINTNRLIDKIRELENDNR
jgi:hypothetical protein